MKVANPTEVVESLATDRAHRRLVLAISNAMQGIYAAAPHEWRSGGNQSSEFIKAVAATLPLLHIGARKGAPYNLVGAAIRDGCGGVPDALVRYEREKLLDAFGTALAKMTPGPDDTEEACRG